MRGVVVVIVWSLDLPLPMQSVSITTDVVGSTPVQHYMIKFVSDLRQVSFINKTDRHDIKEILLKVALNTIKPNQTIKQCKQNNSIFEVHLFNF
jgi:hypothetical protein